MKIKNKILSVNVLTVVCAILTLLSFSAMQGFSFLTLIAIFMGVWFANATWAFVKLENILRKKADTSRRSNTIAYAQKSTAKVA